MTNTNTENTQPSFCPLPCETHCDNGTRDGTWIFLFEQVLGAPLTTNGRLTVKYTGKYQCLQDQTIKKKKTIRGKKPPFTEKQCISNGIYNYVFFSVLQDYIGCSFLSKLKCWQHEF